MSRDDTNDVRSHRTVCVATAEAGAAWSPTIVRPHEAAKADEWLLSKKPWILGMLVTAGAVIFKGLGIHEVEDFDKASAALLGQRLTYTYRSTPRTALGSNIYTATEYPADAHIPLHNENSYQRQWPLKLVFACIRPALLGGDTPLANSVRVSAAIDPAIMDKFKRKGVMYVRYYGHGIDLSWQATFQTDSKAEVDEYCRRHDVGVEWLNGDHLRTRQVCQATAKHPITGDEIWFNQAHLFHPSALGPDRERALRDVFSEAELPRNACYGDGEPIEASALETIRKAYQVEATIVPWQKGDLLLLDNMLVAHGRTPYRGPRQVVVAMGDPSGTPCQ